MKPPCRLPIGLTAVVGTLLSVGVFLLSVWWQDQLDILDFENHARDQLSAINTDLQDANGVLETLRAYMESTEHPVSAAEFARFSDVLRARTAGLRDTGWAPRVSAAGRDAFERAARAAGLEDFQILERDAGGRLVRAGERPEYFPILYVNSSAARRVTGFDVSTDPVRRAAIGQAVATGRPAATPPVTLVTVPRPNGGVMSFVAVRRGRAAPQAGAAPDGLVFGAFEISAMVGDIIDARQRRLDGADLYLFDPAGTPGRRLIHWRPGVAGGAAPAEAALRDRPHWEGTVALIDQRWGAMVLPAQGRATLLPWYAVLPLPLGLLLTAFAVAYLVVSQRRTAQLEALTASLRRTTDDLHANAREISHMARHDALTGLPNRRVFAEELERATKVACRGDALCAVLQVDLDRFKPVNDVHGHAVGDGVLREVARRLRAVVRGSDTVARLGGDEFAAVVIARGADSAARLAERIVAALDEPIVCGAVTVGVGASIGIAIGPIDGRDPEQLLRAADLAMYRAKREGRGAYRFFERRIDAAPRLDDVIEAEAA